MKAPSNRKSSPLVSILISILVSLIFGINSNAGADQNLDLPDLGEHSDSFLNSQQDKLLGKAFMHSLHRSVDIIDDPEINEYIQTLGYRLAPHSGINNPEFNFFVINDSRVNAFAGPGGNIGINSGLILTTTSEDELAGVLAHEIAHITQHHLARTFESASKMGLTTAAGIVVAILLNSIDDQLSQAAIAATLAGSTQTRINFTRDNEKEADRIGIQILSNADFQPDAMASFFQRMHKAARYNNDNIPEFLRTHPVTTSRIADAHSRASQYKISEARQDSISYELFKARTEIITSKSISETKRKMADARGESNESRAALQYGQALALARNSEYKAAKTKIATLTKTDPERAAYNIADAEIEIAAGNPDRAAIILEQALKFQPDNQPLLLTYTRALLLAGNTEKARKILSEYSKNKSISNPMLYQQLAKAEAETGNLINAHKSLAEYFYLTGYIDASLEQLNIALKLAEKDQAYHKAVISTRIEQIKDELSEIEKF